MSKPNCGAIVAPCHYPACLSPDGSQCLWPPTISVTAPKLLEERDAARAEVAGLRAENERLREALLGAARSAEALKRDCGMDPESPQAIRNAQYMAISYAARAALEHKA